MRRRLGFLTLALLSAACGSDRANPFAGTGATRAPSASAVLVYVSGAWASEPGMPRELYALDAAGATPERLTNCAQASPPCDFLQVAPSPDRSRVMAVRSTTDAPEGTGALYFMDLSRSVETLVVQRRQVTSVDWSPDGFFILYSAALDASGREDLFYNVPDGTSDQNLTQSVTVRERSPRIDPFSRTAVFEQIDETGATDESGVGRIYLYLQTPITSGPATGPALPGTPYVVGGDADPVMSPDGTEVAFRRLTGLGNGDLGTWDVLRVKLDGTGLTTVASGPVYRGAPDWSASGILFVETDAATGMSQLVAVEPDGSSRSVLHTELAGFRMAAPRWLR
jgi:Tol biopolymer transport system component